ncbi:hypothetical protein [Streptococcus pluranimalium]|uniref:DUF961 domain-containing protein n=1 Tax=Streptococcus pluranimalium TaxID=82348 RepID=A0A2L0D6C7_9STRE|nr:hypothetical protein [Streptococcus pluranimalium]AUW97388.1 hypothetical protein C0J00_09890 [Streptococcus pluranimalium]AXJ14070.1 hypothetical protein Sp14A_21880 [Streptococcus pluranimalium]
MEIKQLSMTGRLIGANQVKDFKTGLDTGQTQLTIGVRTPDGRFNQTNIKADTVNVSDFASLFDEKVEIIIENVSINAYINGNRAALSIKAKSAFIELV